MALRSPRNSSLFLWDPALWISDLDCIRRATLFHTLGLNVSGMDGNGGAWSSLGVPGRDFLDVLAGLLVGRTASALSSSVCSLSKLYYKLQLVSSLGRIRPRVAFSVQLISKSRTNGCWSNSVAERVGIESSDCKFDEESPANAARSVWAPTISLPGIPPRSALGTGGADKT